MILKGYYCDKQARLYGRWEDLRIRGIKDKRNVSDMRAGTAEMRNLSAV